MLGPLALGFVGGVISSLLVMGGALLMIRQAVQRSPLGRMMTLTKSGGPIYGATTSTSDLAARVAGEG